MSGLVASKAEEQLAQLAPPAKRTDRIGAPEHLARMERARRFMGDRGIDAVIVNAGPSLRYFTGVAWSATERLVALVLPVTGEPVFICPNFELGSLEASWTTVAEVRGWDEDEDPYALAAGVFADTGATTIALDPQAPYSVYRGLREASAALSVVDGAPVIDGCRMIKSAAELALLGEAKAITLEVHRRAARILAPGVMASEVRRFIDAAHRALGADGGSTFCAVQFGEATAYPHGVPGDQRLSEGDIVLIDTGCQVDGYHSDITRTYVFGAPKEEHVTVWEIERAAQRAAFEAARPGVLCEDVDAAARRVLEEAGLGPGYKLPGLPHRTGHGIGLSIHEPAYLVRGDRTPLAPGMCFSCEPMIVVPGRFGIRLEDHFHVTDDGAAWFTEPQPSLEEPFGRV